MVRVGKEIQALEARRPELYAARELLIVEGREVVPPIEHQVAGTHFGIGTKAVLKILRERRKRLEARVVGTP